MGPLDTLLTVLAFSRDTPATAREPHGVPVRQLEIADGDKGARQFVTVMKQEARRALRNPLTIRAAGTIIPADASAPVGIAALRSWLSSVVAFMPDPAGVELLRTPDYLLRLIQEDGKARGDCDDVATLAAALGLAAGYPARFTLYAFGELLPFTHVFCELYTLCQGWIELDTTRPAQMPPGLQVVRVESHEV